MPVSVPVGLMLSGWDGSDPEFAHLAVHLHLALLRFNFAIAQHVK
jgi:hypothetical protein